MPEVGFAELLLWLVTLAVYVAIPVVVIALILRLLQARGSGR